MQGAMGMPKEVQTNSGNVVEKLPWESSTSAEIWGTKEHQPGKGAEERG